jgi:hypothetical protein
MPIPEIKEYTKTHLRAILANPNIDTSKEIVLDAAPKKSKERFYREVHPVIENHCKKIIALDAFKKIKIVPKNVVKILFEKLL